MKLIKSFSALVSFHQRSQKLESSFKVCKNVFINKTYSILILSSCVGVDEIEPLRQKNREINFSYTIGEFWRDLKLSAGKMQLGKKGQF